MINRLAIAELRTGLEESPAVVLLGPRQVGKTTLAQTIADERPSVYLDLESPSDRAKLTEPELYLSQQEDKLVVLDEIQRAPELFATLRGLIDRGRRKGLRTGRFLLLGSASLALLQQSSESLAGRVHLLELPPLLPDEVGAEEQERLWLRGGFPESLTARSHAASLSWRRDFIRSYLERDIPQLGSRIPAESLRRFWTMLAHRQGSLFNAAELGRALDADGKTVASYLDLMVDLLLVRRLPPWHGNSGKRLVKAPKVYVRDSGLVHALLGLPDREALLGHPVVGGSWEGHVIESLIAAAPRDSEAYFYRSGAGAEIDLVLCLPGRKPWVIEVKRSLAPKLERGFYHACEDVQPEARFVVMAGNEAFPLRNDTLALGLGEMMARVRSAPT